MTNAERAAHPCIGPGRADLVVAGCAILEAVWRSWPTGQLRVADRGLREGILQGLMGRSLAQALADPGATVLLPEPLLPVPAAGMPPFTPDHRLSRRPMAAPRTTKVRAAPEQGAAGELQPLARAPHQRPLRAGRARRRLPLAGGLQAARDRRQKFALLRPGRRVIDLGSAPGGWTAGGAPPAAAAWSASICRRSSRSQARPCSQGDIFDPAAIARLLELAGGPVELVLSDLAAAATGQRAVDRLRADALAEAVLDLLPELLAPGGDAVRQAAARRRGRNRRRRPPASSQRTRLIRPDGEPDRLVRDLPGRLGPSAPRREAARRLSLPRASDACPPRPPVAWRLDGARDQDRT